MLVTPQLIWASSAYAFRINSGYVRDDDIQIHITPEGEHEYITDQCLVSNQRLAYYAIMHPDVLDNEDYEVGQDMLAHFGGLIFKALSKKLNSFEQAILGAVERTEWAGIRDVRQHFGIVISLPNTYLRDVKRQTAEHRIAMLSSRHIGNVKERMPLKIKVIKSVYSKCYEIHFVTAQTVEDNVVFFSYKTSLKTDAIYDIKGTVKRHCENGQTQLNRVTVIKVY